MRPTLETLAAWTCPTCGSANSAGTTRCGTCRQLRFLDNHRQGTPEAPRAALGAKPVSESVRVTKCAEGAIAGHPVRESVLQKEAERWLRDHGTEFLHLSYRAREKRGWPDLTFCWRGKPCAVEFKSHDGELTREQMECLDRMDANCWRVKVCRSMPEFLEWLNRLSMEG
jgi:hypothetical protein